MKGDGFIRPYKYEMITLNFEVTRRCNLQCDFCARGHAQNLDMTPEIIDATLDQLDGVYIHSIRLNGGEPTLAADTIVYLINGIIERRIALVSCCIFTNGLCRDERIATALKKLADYLDHYAFERDNPTFEKNVQSLYSKSKPNERISMVISQSHHDNKSQRDKTIQFYSGICPGIGIGLQDDLFKGAKREKMEATKSDKLIISGLAVENMRVLIGDRLTHRSIRTIINQYNFVEWSEDIETPETVKRIRKTIGISANGNIYIGCLMPFDEVDSNPLGNVMHDNIFEAVEAFCWKHPLTKKMNDARETVAAHEALRQAGIGTPDFGGVDRGWLCLIGIFERRGVEWHHRYPNIAPWVIQLITAIDVCNIIRVNMGNDGDKIMPEFVNTCFDPEFKDDIRTMLLSDSGRHDLANQLEPIIQEHETYTSIKNGTFIRDTLGNAIINALGNLTRPKKTDPLPTPDAAIRAARTEYGSRKRAEVQARVEARQRELAAAQQT